MSESTTGESEWSRNTDVPSDKGGSTHQEGVIEYENNSESWEGWQFAPGEVVAAIPGTTAFDPESQRSKIHDQENLCRVGRRVIDAESGFRCYLVEYLNTDRLQLELAGSFHEEYRRLGSLQRQSIDHILEKYHIGEHSSDSDEEGLDWDFDDGDEQE
ncbi:hypothetical protein [Haloarcula sp. 1CSR25-25]|uniref:hypothetical protein n=1 Tax=Haloarcula sp. 1CSR25-25 TaxID=2862545 RepID=UPI00289422E1|nr:hypothetical protein [Haloarcula sp. 1CSR25-25]MDT3437815.1 hypothetical protein [Haloarcula sp. 1CSR25-25]